ncbi:MAG: hypothetical protein AABX15_00695 [Thermoproteota archaeon]|jgi:hypothetical protein
MDELTKKTASKIYCEKCDTVFDSKKKFDEHKHNSQVSGESCPLDSAVQKFANLFRRKK